MKISISFSEDGKIELIEIETRQNPIVYSDDRKRTLKT